MSFSLNSTFSYTISPLRSGSCEGGRNTFRRALAIWGRCCLHRMCARDFPPNVGRIMSRFRSGSTSNRTQSAARPVSRTAWSRPPRSRPFFDAPNRTTSGLCLRTSSAITFVKGRER